MTIGEKIKSLRKEYHITQKQLAELSGLAEITIRQYEANKYTPGGESLRKIAEVLGVKLSEFLAPGQTIREYNPNDDTWDIISKTEDGSLVRNIQASVTNTSFQLSIEQRTLLRYFDLLNQKGRKEVLKRIEELSQLSKYTNL